jgi:hypothetical protein
VEYVFRHTPLPGWGNADTKASGAWLTGYGVAMDLKKMEYLAVDDRGAAGRKGMYALTRNDQESAWLTRIYRVC